MYNLSHSSNYPLISTKTMNAEEVQWVNIKICQRSLCVSLIT